MAMKGPMEERQACHFKKGSGSSSVSLLLHWTPKFNFSFLPPSSLCPFLLFCPFLFGSTLVTDDKAAFPAKPINKLNREKMSI